MADTLPLMKAASAFIGDAQGHGTGYLVAPGRIATCQHVVAGWQKGDRYPVRLGDDAVTVQATLLATNPEIDCAILAFDEAYPAAPLPLATALSRKAIWEGYGFPATANREVGDAGRLPTGLLVDGEVLDPEARDDAGRRAVLLFSRMIAAGQASPLHGFSGSPILVDGAVVGHLTKYVGDPDDRRRAAYGMVYACPVAAVRALLDVKPEPVAIAPPAVTSLADVIPRIADTDYHVFVSYRSTDRPWAMSLVARLEGAGYRVFIDQKELLPGDHLAGQLQTALTRSHAAVVLVSRGWLESRWCQEEAEALLTRAARDERFRLVPLLLDDSGMPPFLESRFWLDFRSTARAEGPTVDRLVYALIGKTPPSLESGSGRVQSTEARLAEQAVEQITAAAGGDPRRVVTLAEEWRRLARPDSTPLVVAAQILLGQGRPDLAYNLLTDAGDGLRVRQLRALAVGRMGRQAEAIELLERLRLQGELDAETGGMLAGRYRMRWIEAGDLALKQTSYQLYRETYERTGSPYTGINAAAMALHCGDRPVAYRLSADVREPLLKAQTTLDHWGFATVAESYLLEEKLDEAENWYRRAVAKAPGLHQDIAVMRRFARLDLTAIGKPRDRLDAALPVPRVVAFTGHMVDAQGRTPPRFPSEKVGKVRLQIRQRLQALGPIHGFSNAARGSDILFIEELLACGGRPFVILPFPEAEFLKVSGGGNWNERFRAIRERPDVEFKILHPAPPESDLPAVFAESNREVQRHARDYARRLDETPIVIAVWDRRPGDGPGGTADAVALWQEEGYDVDVIDITTL